MTDQEQIQYYNGLNDGVHICVGVLSALIEGANNTNDITQLKLMIVNTGNTVADIIESTSAHMDKLIKNIKEEFK